MKNYLEILESTNFCWSFINTFLSYSIVKIRIISFLGQIFNACINCHKALNSNEYFGNFLEEEIQPPPPFYKKKKMFL